MSIIKITLPAGEIPVDGKQVSFVAPCDCASVSGLQIDGGTYTIVDTMGNILAGKDAVWTTGAIVSVVLDVTNKKAYMHGSSGILPIERGGTGATIAMDARVNLGFTHGTAEPSGTPSTGEGSVYFMEDDGSPLPISEGGTNAVTAQEALVNLGVADYIVEQGTTNNWSWEKYANGKIHCALRVQTLYSAPESSGNLYYKDYDVVIPDAVPVLTGTINNATIMPQAGNGLSFFMIKGISGRTISYRYINSASVDRNQLTVLYQFDGRWK